MLREIFKEISIDNKQLSRQLIADFFAMYKQEEPAHDYDCRPLNLYCSLLQIARRLADHSRVYESNRLLEDLSIVARNKERTPAAYAFIDVEKLSTPSSSKQIVKPFGTRSKSNFHLRALFAFGERGCLD